MEAPKVVRKECPIPVIVEEYGGGDRSSSPLLKQSFYGRCFSLPCFRHGRVVGSSSSSSSSSSSIWERLGSSHYDNQWWAPGLRVIKKIREWSELIAGPKWKTFIRRIRRKGCRNPGGVAASVAVPGGGKFNYDLADYSLNFDEWTGNFDYDDEFRRLRSFSVSYGRDGAAAAEGGKKGKEAVGFVTA